MLVGNGLSATYMPFTEEFLTIRFSRLLSTKMDRSFFIGARLRRQYAKREDPLLAPRKNFRGRN